MTEQDFMPQEETPTKDTSSVSDPEKRKTLIKLAATAIAIPTATITGLEITPDKSSEIFRWPERKQTAELFSKIYGINPQDVVLDVWKGGHLIGLNESPEETLLVGELRYEQILDPALADDLPENSSFTLNGHETMGRKARVHNSNAMGSYWGVLASDSNLGVMTDFITKPHQFVDLRGKALALTAITVGTPIIPPTLKNIMDLLDSQSPNSSRSADTNQKEKPNRRDFIKRAGQIVSGFFLGGLTKNAIMGAVSRTDYIFPDQINTSAIPNGRGKVYEVLNQVDESRLRNRIMFLNTASFGVRDLPIKKLQISFANGHQHFFELSSQSLQKTSEELLSDIDKIYESSLTLMAADPENLVTRDDAQMLLLDINILLAPQVNRKNIDVGASEAKGLKPDKVCSSPFLLLLRYIRYQQELIDSGHYSQDPNIRSNLTSSLIFSINGLNYNNWLVPEPDPSKPHRFTIDFPGDKAQVDEVVELYGKTYKFSKGLLAEIITN